MSDFKELAPVLIVSADIKVRDSIASRLRYVGLGSELSGSGFQALHLLENAVAEKNIYSILMLIDTTDDMPCDEVICLSRNVLDEKQLPILLLTRDADPEYILETKDAGATMIMPDTDNFQLILDAIKKITAKKRPK